MLSAELRILIVADDPLARAGLSMLLAEQDGPTVVGQVSAGGDLALESQIYAPEVVLWDLGWEPALARPEIPTDDRPAKTVFEHLADLREAEIPVVVLLPDETYGSEIWAAGARGLLPREAPVEAILAALQAAAQGLATFDLAFSEVFRPARDFSPPGLVEELTPRELEVLQLLAEGLPNKAIAQRLKISDHTVKFHVNAIMSKLAAQSRTEAVVRATRLGLILL